MGPYIDGGNKTKITNEQSSCTTRLNSRELPNQQEIQMNMDIHRCMTFLISVVTKLIILPWGCSTSFLSFYSTNLFWINANKLQYRTLEH